MAVGVFVTQQGVACRRTTRASSVRAPHARANGALTAFARPAASRSSVRRSVAAGVAATETGLTDAQRLALARELGYRTIGKELPDHVSLSTVIGSIPAECFELDHGKAWRAVGLTLTAMAASLALIAVSPWWFLPVAWFIAGTAFTGFFVIGHDAGHRAFHRNNLVEDIVGTIMFMPLIYPFEPWRIKHNHHHAHTNKLVEDTAWHPVMPDELEELNSTFMGKLTKAFLGSPLKLWASIGHWWIWHFDVGLYSERQKPRVIVSLIAVAAFALIGFPLMIHYLGWAGWAKFWLMPWLGYHFWMSTFTVIHHTAPHIPFKPAESWNAAQAQLAGTVHCDFPRWVETLCHDINWHIPHHVNAKIPWYNLRAATDSIRENWGEYLTEGSVNWRMLKNIFTECHVYDEKKNYIAFDADREELFFAAQRRLMPNSM